MLHKPIGVFLSVIAIGAYLRFDQFSIQVLADDEWHALMRVIEGRPDGFLLSFGFSDHSIPLALLYWFEASWFGLSELSMRWPMLLAGLLILTLFPLRVSRTLGWRVALVFALLLAISPLLINYSRQARPYGLTLLLGYVAHWSFLRYRTGGNGQIRTGLVYAVSAGLAGWLHLVSLPFVLAPLIPAGLSALLNWKADGGRAFRHIFGLALPTALLLMLLIGPPLLVDPGALLAKSGSDLPQWDTLAGVWHTWLGTPSVGAVLICLGLAVVGIPQLRRAEPLAGSILFGIALTLAMLMVTQPAWVHSPLAFGRYLLPAQPLLLLSVAVGAARLVELIRQRWGTGAMSPALLLPALVLVAYTPLTETLSRPNSSTLHSYFQADYRRDRHGAREIVAARTPLSHWWAKLRQYPPASLVIAAAPYYFFSPRWDAPRWESVGGQRVIPGFLTGLCVDRRDGETPIDRRFSLHNAVHLADDNEMRAKGVDLIVFQKPYVDMGQPGSEPFGQETAHCLNALRSRFGTPQYEDELIAVFNKHKLAEDKR